MQENQEHIPTGYPVTIKSPSTRMHARA